MADLVYSFPFYFLSGEKIFTRIGIYMCMICFDMFRGWSIEI